MFAAQTAGSLFGAVMGAQQDVAQYDRKVKAINDEGEAINRSTILQYKLSQLQQQQIQDRTTLQVADERLKLAEAEGNRPRSSLQHPDTHHAPGQTGRPSP